MFKKNLTSFTSVETLNPVNSGGNKAQQPSPATLVCLADSRMTEEAARVQIPFQYNLHDVSSSLH